MDEGTDRADPSEAFALVADETRYDILQALWDLTVAGEDGAVPFARLRRAAGVSDSGQFNYHLDTLTPEFVRAGEEGYVLTTAGRRVVGAAVSGVYTDTEVTAESQPVGDCPECAGRIEAGYEHGRMAVGCADCGMTFSDMPAPPVLAATHEDAELPAVLSKHLLTEVERMNRGFCVHCGGPVDSSVEPEGPDAAEEEWNWNAVFDCRACGATFWSLVPAAVLDHPAVVSLLHEAGVDIRETPLWDLDPFLSAATTVVDEDPLRVETTFATDEASLALTLDEDLEVVEYDRRDATGAE